jgi:hypothetical protein
MSRIVRGLELMLKDLANDNASKVAGIALETTK